MLILWVFGVVLAFCIGRYGQNPQNQPTTAQAQTDLPAPTLTVEAVTPTVGQLQNTLSASGTITGKNTTSVSAQISSVLVQHIAVQEGDFVQKGQLLAVLDDSALQEQISALRAEQASAAVGLAKAEADLARAVPLIAIDAISRQQFDAYQSAQKQAKEQVNATTARLKQAQINQNHTRVLAPVSGIISQKNTEIGALTTNAPLFEIIQDGKLQWQAGVDAHTGQNLALGQPITLPNNEIAHITRIAPTANSSRQWVVYADLAPDSTLKSGMYLTGKITLNTTPALFLPQSAVLGEDGYQYVYTLSPIDKSAYPDADTQDFWAHKTFITVHGQQNDQIATDLPKDSLVVKQSGLFLHDQDRVRLIQNQP